MKPFKEIPYGIRNAVMASEVREDIAQGLEYVEQFANTAGENVKKAIDPTLSLSGKAADAKATGDAVGALKEDLDNILEEKIKPEDTTFYKGTYNIFDFTDNSRQDCWHGQIRYYAYRLQHGD